MLVTHIPISMPYLVPSGVVELAAPSSPEDNRTLYHRSRPIGGARVGA